MPTKKKTVPVFPIGYIVIEYQDGRILSSGKKTKAELEKIRVGDYIKVENDEEIYVVETVKYDPILILYIFHVSEDAVTYITL